MKKILKTIGIALGILFASIPLVAYAVQITVPSAPTSGYTLVSSTTGNYLTKILPSCSSASNALTFDTGLNGFGCNTITGGGGSGGGPFATTTSQVPGRLIIYPLNTTDILCLSNTATSTCKFVFDPNTQIGYFSGNVGIQTRSPNFPLETNGEASSSKLSGAGLATCNSNTFLTWASSLFGCSPDIQFSTTSADAYINASSTIAHPGGGSAGNLMEWNGSGWVSIATTSSAIGLQPRIGLTTTGSSGAATFDGTTLNIPQYTGGSSAYPFSVTTPTTGNATSTLTQFNGGLTAFASSTIGSGSGTGLTVSGNQVVTGTILAGGNITTSQNVSGVAQVVISNSGNGITGGSGFRVTNNLAHGGNFQVNSSAFINNGTLKPDQTVISNDTGTGGINITNINGSQDISIGINKNFSSLFISSTTNNVGISTTSPYAQLSVVGQVVAQYFTATSTTVASTFPYASTTNISADTICLNGDTCRTTWPTGGGGAYPFNVAVNSTSTLVGFNGGLTSFASSTIGAGGQATGLTISGGATTTGTQIIQGTGTSTYTGGINVDTQGNGCGFADNGVCIQTYIQNATAYKSAANYATVSALPTNTYNNGTSGVGATLTEVGTGALSVDGASPSIGQRILVKNEATQANNGVYTVTVTGSGIAAYILTRSSDFNTSNDVYAGVTVPVLSGTANGGSAWVQTTTGVITIGTTAIVFSESSFGTGVLPWASGGTNNSVSYASSTIPISDGTKLYPIATSSLGLQQALTLTTTGSSGASTLSANGVLNIPQYTGGGGSSQVVGGFTQPATSTSVTLNLATTVTATSTTIQLNMASSNYTIFPINATSSLGAWWYLDLTAPMSGSIGSTTISYCNWNGQIAPGTSVVNGLTDEYKLSVTASTTAAGVFTPFLKCDYVGSY